MGRRFDFSMASFETQVINSGEVHFSCPSTPCASSSDLRRPCLVQGEDTSLHFLLRISKLRLSRLGLRLISVFVCGVKKSSEYLLRMPILSRPGPMRCKENRLPTGRSRHRAEHRPTVTESVSAWAPGSPRRAVRPSSLRTVARSQSLQLGTKF